ncbi:XRE family transcriptional regulator [Acinetobacter rudis]|uniref:XRE family transcriptional regulator n=1 Tax=Acinetobacter rudis TaxID=632955 RepID=UPI003DA7A10B
MNDVRDRLILKMKELNLRQADLIRALNVSKGTVSKWVAGVNTPNASVLPKLAKLLHTTPEWLIHGGENNSSLMNIDTWDETTPLEDDEVEIPFFKDFSFACGSGSINEHIANEKRKLRVAKSTLRNLCIDKENAVAATATGDSMNPTINDGDTIHVDLGRKEVKDGRIFAICIGGLHYSKRLYNMPLGGVRIVSDNAEEFPEIVLTADEVIDQQFEVVGWVWQITRIEKW